MLGGLALEKLLEEVERSRDEAQAVEDHGLNELAGAQVFLLVSAQEAVDLCDQADLIHNAGDYPQVVDVIALDRWYLCLLIHAPQNTPQLFGVTCGMWV